ncbi:MAG: hypothetical protein ACJ74H_03255 [Thermoanaerobaculia bacterium]
MRILAPRFLIVLLAASLIATVAFSEDSPDRERGTRPGLAYRLEGLDQVNMFNGNINLTIPLGPSYPVGGTLSYSFAAHYATNAWESMTHEEDIEGAPFESRVYTYWYPSEHANAGFGWIVSLGRLDTTQHPEDGSDALVYVSPDGGKHGFKPTLHENNPSEHPVTGVEYTRDGTYLRLRHLSPSGYRVDFPNGHMHTFNALGLLTRMEDPFGNHVDVEYTTRGALDPLDSLPFSTVWRITDSVGREQRVYFRPGWDYVEDRLITDPGPMPKQHEMVDKVELEAFDGQTARYQFKYNILPVAITDANKDDIALKTSRRCSNGVQDPEIPRFERVSFLTSLGMPLNVEYRMVMDRGDQLNCSFTFSGGISGNITKLTLPTGGTIDWTYGVYGFPTLGRSSWNAGVATRTARLTDGGTVTGTTLYGGGSVSDELMADKYRIVVNKNGDSTVVNATKHYFAACPKASWCGSATDYGLPYRRSDNLSTEVLIPNSSGTLESKRKTYVRYEADTLTLSGPEWKNRNQRPVWQKTEYDDGTFEEVTYDDFDGLGHYRKAVTNGNFESGNVRTSWTNYNPGVATYKLNADGDLVYPYTLPTGDWLLTNFDKQWVSEPNAAGQEIYSRTSVCFNADGFMTSRRIHKDLVQPTLVADLVYTHDSKDLLAVFTPDGSTGNLIKEQYFGGDLTDAPSQNCNTPYIGEAYRIDHTYAYGAEESSYYVEPGDVKMSFYITDNVIDKTGFVSAARRFRTQGLSDGLSTSFSYDLLGRLKEIAGTRRKTLYTYSLAPARITATEKTLAGLLLKTSTEEFDAFGRLTKETRSMPNSGTSTRSTTYNGLGWRTAVTDWGASSATSFAYDGFGRVTSIQPPDSSIEPSTISYTGIAQVVRKSRVRTGGTGTEMTLADSVTTEDYDRQRRLIRVTEPLSAVDGVRPKTEYGYDVGGRLTSVCANVSDLDVCGQSRTFAYDNRGFLTSETHPENGTTTYVSYDARGHLRRRYVGSPYQFDVEFQYDRAERLEKVYERVSGSETRPLKEFFYANANTADEKKNGQLFEAVRHNWITIPAATPVPYNVQVIETYAYADADGNVSSRVTADYPCPVSSSQKCKTLRPVNANRSFSQEFRYEQLNEDQTLLTSSLLYPKCVTGLCASLPERTVTNTYAHDLLTNVSSANDMSASITYHQSGLADVISHGNGVADQQRVDPLMPGRPREIVTSGVTAVQACVKPSFNVQPSSTTIESDGAMELTASATGQDGLTIAYQWYRGTSGDTSNPISAPPTTGPSITTSYWVRATNNCGSADSITATISICNGTHITVPQPDLTMTRGESRTLQITAIGSATVTFEWFTIDPATGAETLIPGAVSRSLVVSPSQTVKYRVRATNACDTDSIDIIVTVADPPTTPTSIAATYNPSINRNDVVWTASSSTVGISHYLVKRHPGNLTFTVSAPALSYNDQTALSSGGTYVYRVAAVDMNGIASPYSASDIASVRTFTGDPLPGPIPEVRAVYVSELRLAVDSVRAAAGLSAAWSNYAPPTQTLILAADFVQLRDRLNEARAALEMPAVELTAPVVAGQLMYGSILASLRNGTK